MKHGIWVDDPPTRCMRPGYVGALASIGIDVVGVAIDGFHDGFSAMWTPEQGEVFARHCDKEGIERVLTFAAEPTQEYLDDLEEKLPALVEALRPTRIEPDVEGPYEREDVRGFRSLQDASNRLIGIVEATGLPMQLTTFPRHAEAKPGTSTLGKAVRWFAIQVYSNKNFLGKDIPFNGHVLSPGTFQERELARWQAAWDGVHQEPELIAGLAAYSQTWFGRDPVLAMRIAYMAAVAANVAEVWWWSSKFAVGVKKNGYAARAIRELTGREAASPPMTPIEGPPNLGRVRQHLESALEELGPEP